MANGARERKEARKLTHGWFDLPERPGDRTLLQQLTGLSFMLDEVAGKSVLDIGCAEGLISIECARAGAKSTFGFDYFEGHLAVSRKLAEGYPCEFDRLDANEYLPTQNYDVVLMLAVLHKLRNPSECCERFAKVCNDLCVIRLSPDGTQVITDGRSNFVPHDIGGVMQGLGFVLERSEPGPFGEMTHYYRRKA